MTIPQPFRYPRVAEWIDSECVCVHMHVRVLPTRNSPIETESESERIQKIAKGMESKSQQEEPHLHRIKYPCQNCCEPKKVSHSTIRIDPSRRHNLCVSSAPHARTHNIIVMV